jgi:hypothetical protein
MEPVSGETIVLPLSRASEEQAEAVIKASRVNYGVEWSKLNDKYSKSQLKDVGKIKEEEDNDGFNPQAEALEV